uniref:Uncharacterized protein n=1 Tax=Candidatus Kentrum sp. UNK TaxID=2126344 RepID=A0A451AB32_9GAMM|nr:MAG: hypothetical protein BECKUNK1418G_GA0071005_103113 [Candidatus Kentron sp. UNK]VFK70780.1 MAG: hypothetical protein BECKUNK1418H_GA0071006_103813 [Candidatus Kentron sp. UNK]
MNPIMIRVLFTRKEEKAVFWQCFADIERANHLLGKVLIRIGIGGEETEDWYRDSGYRD